MGNRVSNTSQIGDEEETSPPPPSTPRRPSQADQQTPQPVAGQQEGGSVSYYTMLKNSYQQLVNAIIRPPRCTYSVEQLGPTEFDFCGRRFQRIDFSLRNPRGLRFECSLWEPVDGQRHAEHLPCVIYMHGNSSARLEALSSLSVVLSMGATLLAMDFTGSGLSEGDYVTLGAFEKDDLQAAIEYLRNHHRTSTIALWGRSMGAATALMHAERDPSIAGMVLDSSFSDLVVLAEDMVEKGRQQGLFAPGFLVKLALRFVRSSVQKAAQFDIKTLAPITHCDRCFVPALFIAADNDAFVLPKHSQLLYTAYGGDKNLITVEGDHNSPRPRYLYDSVSIFLETTLQIPGTWRLSGGENFVRRLPWTYRATHPLMLQSSQRMGSSSSLEPGVLNTYSSMESIPDPQMSYLTADELLALTLMQEEVEMQRGVEDSLFTLLRGGVSQTGTVAAPPSDDSSSPQSQTQTQTQTPFQQQSSQSQRKNDSET